MSSRRTLATCVRVLDQLRHDRRTLALIILVPCLLEVVLKYVFDGRPAVFNIVGVSLLGLFPFTVMFIVCSITTLRERTSGTLERLLTLPLGQLDFLLGYALAFTLLAVVQVLLVSGIAIWVLGLEVMGSQWWLVLAAGGSALLGMSLGLCVSALAQTEFQAVQFMPAIVLPQVLLAGLLVPRTDMNYWLEIISRILPLTYALDALQQVGTHAEVTADFGWDMVIILGYSLLALAVGALTLRRVR